MEERFTIFCAQFADPRF